MNSTPKPTANTYVISGILQGKVTIEPDFLEIWNKEAAKKGLFFSLRIDANEFSLLPSEQAKPISKLENSALEDVVCDHVSSLIGLFDSPSSAQLFSTLRSEEFKFNKSQQTIYRIQSDGRVDAESRTVEIDTEDPPPELTTGGKLKLGFITLAVLLLAFLATLPFVDYKAMFEEAKDKVTTLKADELKIDTSKLQNTVKISVKEIIKKESQIILLIEKDERWDSLYKTTPETTFSNWNDFSVAKSLHSRLRCEWYDRHGNLLLINYIDVNELDGKQSIERTITIKIKAKVATLKVIP